MAYKFFGVYFEDPNGVEYRCGFRTAKEYQPKLYVRRNNSWAHVTGKGANSSQAVCAAIRAQLPVPIPFPAGAHTQNQRLELIHQLIYNLNRKIAEGNNYGGAHG